MKRDRNDSVPGLSDAAGKIAKAFSLKRCDVLAPDRYDAQQRRARGCLLARCVADGASLFALAVALKADQADLEAALKEHDLREFKQLRVDASELWAAQREGLNTNQAARRVGLQWHSLRSWARRHGVAWAKIEKADWQRCFDDGLTAPQAARKLGRSEASAYQWAKRRNLTWAGVEMSGSQWQACFDEGLTLAEAVAKTSRGRNAGIRWSHRTGLSWPDVRQRAKGAGRKPRRDGPSRAAGADAAPVDAHLEAVEARPARRIAAPRSAVAGAAPELVAPPLRRLPADRVARLIRDGGTHAGRARIAEDWGKPTAWVFQQWQMTKGARP